MLPREWSVARSPGGLGFWISVLKNSLMRCEGYVSVHHISLATFLRFENFPNKRKKIGGEKKRIVVTLHLVDCLHGSLKSIPFCVCSSNLVIPL